MDYNRFIPLAWEVVKNIVDTKYTFRHVSIVLSNKSIVAVGTNEKKTHPLNVKYGYKWELIHSELSAYSKIRYRQGNFVLLNFRFNKTGILRGSKPCKYCLPWCIEVFDEIWYSTNKGTMMEHNENLYGL